MGQQTLCQHEWPATTPSVTVGLGQDLDGSSLTHRQRDLHSGVNMARLGIKLSVQVLITHIDPRDGRSEADT